MGDEGGCSRNWEEGIYWSHFQSAQFFQTLSGRNYRQQLAIPQKFANNLKEKLVGAVSLKGPSGVQWRVGLKMSGDTIYLKDGWKQFVEDHSLQQTDVLIFKYVGDLRFDGLMFDHQSLCEKESSYFICNNEETGCKRKSNAVENIEDTEEPSSESSRDISESPPSKKSRKHDASPPPSSRRGRGRGQKICSPINRDIASGPLSLHRRIVTSGEKDKALTMACESASEDSFIIVMRPTHVYKGFYLQIPCEWARKYLANRSQELTLKVKDRTWNVRYQLRDPRDHRTGGGLSGGWRKFAVDNALEEFDVCLFNLVSETKDGIVLDVSIFRVVEREILVTRVPAINLRGRKPIHRRAQE